MIMSEAANCDFKFLIVGDKELYFIGASLKDLVANFCATPSAAAYVQFESRQDVMDCRISLMAPNLLIAK